VGSLCFFLMDVRYRGKMDGALCWVMFWFVLAIVLVSRIAIEQSSERAAIFGFALGATLWLYLIRTSPAYLFAILLMAAVWYCAHKLVFDCTLIDEDEDSSGQGLLQKSLLQKTKPELPKPGKTSPKTVKKPRKVSSSPGRSVLYFSLAALPLFGVGQVLLPADATSARQLGFNLLFIYLTSALGLLVTTSFLGLRRYLRQRFLPMPGVIALAWVKFGAGVALAVLIGAIFLPRPGATVAWATLSAKVDQQIRKSSQYASRNQKPGSGESKQTTDSDSKNSDNTKSNTQADQQQAGNNSPSKTDQSNSSPLALSSKASSFYYLLRNSLLIAVAILVGWWLFRCRHLLAEMVRSMIAAFQNWLQPRIKHTKPIGTTPILPKRRPLAEFKNPFYATENNFRPPEEIILYTYEALQAWAHEQGLESHPEQTSREFCQQMTARTPELADPLRQLAFLHAYAAYGLNLPPNCDMEPLKELWRQLTWK
jgi:hypothetical protein